MVITWADQNVRPRKRRAEDRGNKKALLRLAGFSVSTFAALTISHAAYADRHENRPPSFSCLFHGLEIGADGHYEAGNLDRLNLRPSLFANRHRMEKVFDAAEALRHQVKDEPTLEITVTSLSDDRGQVRILTPSSGGGGAVIGGNGALQKHVNLAIPISIEKRRTGFEGWYQRVLELEDPDGDAKRTEELRARLRTKKVKEGAFAYLGGSIYENEPGLYRINCSYRSSKQGFWNGKIEARPITLRIYFEKSAFDNLLPAAQPTK